MKDEKNGGLFVCCFLLGLCKSRCCLLLGVLGNGGFGWTFVRDCWGAPGLGAKVEGFCCWGACLVLLLVLRCNAATAKVGEIAFVVKNFLA